MIRLLSIFALTIVTSLCLTGCQPQGGNDTPDPTLRVGMELTFPPFEMRNEANQPDGISVRMAEALAERLGRPVEIVDVAWEGLIPALKSEKIDIIISSMTKTEERARSIAFSDGYVTNGLCLLVAADSPIQSAADLEAPGTRLAVKLATTGELWAREHLPEAQINTPDTSAACVLEVVQGKSDAFVFDQISIYQFWKKYPEETRMILKPIRAESWAVGLRQGDDEMLEQVNAFLADFREQGGFDRLAERYMAEEKAAFEEMGVPFLFE